jgi:flagellin
MSVINTNITSMIGQQNLSKSQNDLTTSMERLSSGLRINSAKDDAAGQAIANRFSSQITGLGQAQRNANDGISIAQTAEGGLNQVNDNLQRVRELTVQASNGTNSQSDLESIQNEINQRMEEINRISEETDFNGTKVLAEDNGLKIQVGADDGQTINVGLQQITSQTLGLDGFNVDGSGAIANRSATVTDLTSIGATDLGNNQFSVVENFDAVDLEGMLGELGDRDTVEIDNVTYAFDSASGNFSFTDNETDYAQLAADNLPSAGNTNSGTFEFGDGSVANFEVDASGNLTVGGQAAVITDDGVLTANNPDGRGQATLEDLFTLAGADDASTANMSIEINDVAFNGTGASTTGATTTFDTTDIDFGAAASLDETALSGLTNVTAGDIDDINDLAAALTSSDEITSATVDGTNINIVYADAAGTEFTFTDDATAAYSVASGDITPQNTQGTGVNFANTATAAEVLSSADGEVVTVNLSSGVTNASVDFDGTGALANTGSQVYVDNDGELTTTASVTTQYGVNPETGEVAVTSSNGEGKYAVEEGATAYISSEGRLTTEETSAGERTTDPLAALDAALAKVDGLRSDLGAIQNRFESAITNLQTNETNLSAARSRIEDADYATEVANMTRAQILQQAGTSVLAQANQIPQSVLSLLG